MTVLVLENCPSLITYSQVENRRILEILSNRVLSSKNVRLSVVNKFFFARFLDKHLVLQFHSANLYVYW